MGERAQPEWQTGEPPEPGLYLAFSADPARTDDATLCTWDGKVWQMWIGWYDHAITHWLPTNMPITKAES